VWLPWSRRFVRHQDRQNWHMSYIDVICVIWHQMTRMTSDDAYDINIYDIGRFGRSWCLKKCLDHSNRNCFKIQKLKSGFRIFVLYKFWKSFEFYAKTLGKLWWVKNASNQFYFLFVHSWIKENTTEWALFYSKSSHFQCTLVFI
jgi:hypothetical protein